MEDLQKLSPKRGLTTKIVEIFTTSQLSILFLIISLLAGAVVLAAALSATRDERVREAALLRSFGASRQQLVQAQRLELLIIGALAGLLAGNSAAVAQDVEHRSTCRGYIAVMDAAARTRVVDAMQRRDVAAGEVVGLITQVTP